MIPTKSALAERISRVWNRWRGFWFHSEPAYTLGIVRVAFGALVFIWSLEIGQDLYNRFGTQGFVPKPPSRQFLWTIFELYPSDSALFAGWIVLMVSSVALMLGWHSRLAAILVFLLVLSFERRNPWIFNGGDALIRMEAFFMVLAPCGAALSLDQRRRTGSFFSAQEREMWVLRLMQVQLSVIYLSTVVAKLRGDTWQNGTAVSYALRLEDMLLLPTPAWLSETALIAQALTWGTLLIEVGIGVLVWNKRWRLRVLLLGVVLHLVIMLTMAIGFFSFAMFVLYLAFVPSGRAQLVADGFNKRLDGITARIRRRKRNPEDEYQQPPPGDESPDVDRDPAVPVRSASRQRPTLPVAEGDDHRPTVRLQWPTDPPPVHRLDGRPRNCRARVPDPRPRSGSGSVHQDDGEPSGRHARRSDRQNGDLTRHLT